MTPEQKQIVKLYKVVNCLRDYESNNLRVFTTYHKAILSDFSVFRKFHLLSTPERFRFSQRYPECYQVQNFIDNWKTLKDAYRHYQRRVFDNKIALNQLRQAVDSGDIRIDYKEHLIIYTTENIILEDEDVSLGEFEIRLNYKYMSYTVHALNPPVRGYEHPHVSKHVLCEGQGEETVDTCLFNGFIMEFFDTVETILKTYNGDSPHHNISIWKGIQCLDCGDTIDEDDSFYCEICSKEIICRDCICGCGHRYCSSRYCSECEATCDSCGDSLCQNHRYSFSNEDETYCKSCYKTEEERRDEEEARAEAEAEAEAEEERRQLELEEEQNVES